MNAINRFLKEYTEDVMTDPIRITEADMALLTQEEFDTVWKSIGVVLRARALHEQQVKKDETDRQRLQDVDRQ